MTISKEFLKRLKINFEKGLDDFKIKNKNRDSLFKNEILNIYGKVLLKTLLEDE